MLKKSRSKPARARSGKTEAKLIETAETTRPSGGENKTGSTLNAFGKRFGGLDLDIRRDAKPIDAADFGDD